MTLSIDQRAYDFVNRSTGFATRRSSATSAPISRDACSAPLTVTKRGERGGENAYAFDLYLLTKPN